LTPQAAKQDAFEEAARLKNQYRALDDDEAEFLDSVLEGSKKKEAEVQKETLEQLDAFRRRQEEAERRAFDEEQSEGKDKEGESQTHAQWVAAGRKRKKGHELLKGVKIRRKSEAAEEMAKETKEEVKLVKETVPDAAKKVTPDAKSASEKPTSTLSPPKCSGPVALNLGYASSDEED
jgi:LPS O-antigen subunit length determinant protein (WzzB/FepE family)